MKQEKRKNNFHEAKEYRDIREMLQEVVVKYPKNKAFIIKHQEREKITYENITYQQFQENVIALGAALMELGLANKKIAIIANNRYEWCLAYYTTLCGLGIVVPLDRSLPEGEIENCLTRSETDAVIFEEKYNAIMQKIKNKNTSLQYYISMDEKEDGEFLSLTKLVNRGKELVKQGDKSYLETTIDPEEMRILLFTSGTTSASKAVMLSHKNLMSNVYALNSVETIYSDDISLAFLPLHHTFGSTALLLFMSNGVTTVFCDGLKYIQKNLVEYKVSVFVCVPLLLEAMNKKIMKEVAKKGKTKVIQIGMKVSNFLLKMGIDIRKKLFKEILDSLGGNLRFVVSGAAGIDKQVAKNFNAFGIRTVQGYGLTETSPVLAAEDDWHIRYGSVGLPMRNVEIRIDEPNEEGMGEIIAKGPNIMAGYYKNEETTKDVLIDGWFHTGDLGYIDKDGFLFITGRKKNVIVMKNGKNIYPEELELLIAKLPYVSENMVFGIPTKEDDLDLAVKIVYNQEYVEEMYPNMGREELKDMIWKEIKQINKTMPPYKYIRELIVTEEPMIKTTTQKIKRYEEIKKITQER